MTRTAATRCAVIGHPVAHSLSPLLHRAAYRELGLSQWRYDAIDVTVDGLEAFLGGLDESWAGLSVTAPLKQACVPFLDSIDKVAQAVGAVNTVVLGPHAGARVGANTDVAGIVGAVRAVHAPGVEHGAIIGGGATAASALAALVELGVADVAVFVRARSRAEAVAATAERLGMTVTWETIENVARAARADLTISTIPLAGSAALAQRVADSGDGAGGMLLDVVYESWPTPLAAAWRGPVVSGYRMLLYQAVEQVRLMTGRSCSVDVLAAQLPDDGNRRNESET